MKKKFIKGVTRFCVWCVAWVILFILIFEEKI